MVEIELSVLVRQCLKPRLPDVETFSREVQAWIGASGRMMRALGSAASANQQKSDGGGAETQEGQPETRYD